MKKFQKPLLRLKHLPTNWILASMFLIVSYIGNAQTSIPYSGGLITIDSLKAQRIQTDLLQLQTFKDMASISDKLLIHYQQMAENQKAINLEQSKLIAQQNQEQRIYKKRLFWSRCEIWVYRVGIIAGTYFLLK